MMWTKENMFEPSGCLTREAFEALVNHQLPSGAKAMADEHVASCPFCSDALEGYNTQEADFAILMDKTDSGFANMTARARSKSTKKRALWISVSAAASVIMLVGLFMLINQSQPKMQVAQNTQKGTIVNKSEKENKPVSENSEKMKQVAPETRTIPAKPAKKTVQFVSPEISKSEEVSTNGAVTMETQTNAPIAVPLASEEKMVVANVVSKDDRKETEAYKKGSDKSATMGMAKSRRAVDSPAAVTVMAEKMELKSPLQDTLDNDLAEIELKQASNKSSKTKKASDKEPITFVDKMPEYPGGSDAMFKFLYKNAVYPPLAKEKKISGKVFVQFVVEKDGKISNIKVIRGIGGGCDEEAMRVISLMPAWKPGTQNGKPVPVYFTLPIIFSR